METGQQNAFSQRPTPVETGDVFELWPRKDRDAALCVLVNTSPCNSYDIPVRMAGEAVSELVGGEAVPIADVDGETGAPNADAAAGRYAIAHLGPRASAILHFHPRRRLASPVKPGFGVLAHITSVPASGPGTLGSPAFRFVDWLAQAGVRYWQVLPANPVDGHGSPYAGISAFAGNANLLGGADTAAAARDDPDGYAGFCEREADWLEPFAFFMAIHEKLGADRPWQTWPDRYRSFDPDAICGDDAVRDRAERWRQVQFAFERSWGDLRAYADERGVKVIGDMPIYVNADSADVWANPGIFQLDADGYPKVVAGCPPDSFAADGQIWQNPVYDWEACKDSGYRWWLRRLERAFSLYDLVRLDHFIGFSQYYAIPSGHPAADGSFHPGPGLDLFREAFGKFGALPIVAEDLGLITAAVRGLGADCGFPGMDVVQFADGNDPLSGYRPRPEKIVYTGTHDNQTLVGYCRERYPHLDARETARALMEEAATCGAPVCIVPLQDLMLLGDDARMNTPGTAEGNWSWQADRADMQRALETARQLASLHAEACRTETARREPA